MGDDSAHTYKHRVVSVSVQVAETPMMIFAAQMLEAEISRQYRHGAEPLTTDWAREAEAQITAWAYDNPKASVADVAERARIIADWAATRQSWRA